MPDNSVLRWLRKQKNVFSFSISLDRLYLLDELVEKGEFKNRSKAIEAAIDLLLKQYYPEIDENMKLGDFVRADELIRKEVDA
jgi:Arc/MetJ-type ribon-helix-helix transcriptional regulator